MWTTSKTLQFTVGIVFFTFGLLEGWVWGLMVSPWCFSLLLLSALGLYLIRRNAR